MKKLVTVTDTFAITGRGLAVVPGITEPLNGRVEVEVNGHRVTARVEYVLARGTESRVLVLPLEKSQVPIGSDVFLVEP